MPKKLPGSVHANGYAIPRNHVANVRCSVVTGPNNDDTEHAQVAWTLNGAPQPNGETLDVPATADGRFDVTCSYQGEQKTASIWVFWCTLTLTAAGARPAGCNINFAQPNNTVNANPNQLGAHHGLVNGIRQGVGRVCLTGTFTPAGIHNQIRANLRMTRTILHEKTSTDGGALVHRQNRNDITSRNDKKQWRPNTNDQIFDLDAPNIAFWGYTDGSVETYIDFRQQVTYAGVLCSNTVDWHFVAELLAGTPVAPLLAAPAAPQVVRLQRGPAHTGTIARLLVGAGLHPVTNVVSPRYGGAVRADGDVDLTNNGER